MAMGLEVSPLRSGRLALVVRELTLGRELVRMDGQAGCLLRGRSVWDLGKVWI